ncbi:FecCD family ABC transporter permease [Candidatus Symbiobacter mobilis]|uniref:Iron complex transporter permease protein n=1 Tax=Candidatus Symbiobacter mobilis CR TaxID=946483 RepID=U5N4A6_9BURK|nr:iron ABC transporter permease [Candidatus Symbiobacter mobilis]AGX86316.1 iron complex transporter permease protein [Candidatus Symbiobacter mobilis CR]
MQGSARHGLRCHALAVALVAGTIVAFALAVVVGVEGWQGGATWWDDPFTRQIVWEIRLPRTMGAWLAGALLGLAGMVAQGLFRNPLADPYLLGSASGAALGVVLVLSTFGMSPVLSEWAPALGVTGAAFLGGVIAVLLTVALAAGVQDTLRLLLAGVVVSTVLGAVVSMVTLRHPGLLAYVQTYLLGSTALVGWVGVVLMMIVWACAIAVVVSTGLALDALGMGEDTARSLGLPVSQVRVVLILILGLTTGTAVAQTGIIAFVGLAAAHMVRSVVPVRHAALAVLSSLAGGVLLAWTDLLARCVAVPSEWPVGVVTAFLGGCYLLGVLHLGKSTGRGAL